MFAEAFDIIVMQQLTELLRSLVQVDDHHQTSFMLFMVKLKIALSTLKDNVSMMACTLSVLYVLVTDAFQSSLAVMAL